MTKLTQPQRDLLERAAGHEDGAIDAPDDAKPTVAALIKRGLMISLPVEAGPSRLLITQPGRREVGAPGAGDIETSVAETPSAAGPRPTRTKKSMNVDAAKTPAGATPSAGTPKGKIGRLVDLLRQPEGATIETLMVATGWQAHSVRGAISGAVKKGLGLAVASEKIDGGRVYRIASEAQA